MSADPGESLAIEQSELFDLARAAVEKARALFSEAASLGHASGADMRELSEQVEDPFAVFVCGEFNSGKSSLINALAGEAISEVGVLPTTTEIVPLRSPSLPALVFVDSPGLNSILDEHQKLTERYLKRSDFVLFITSVERPLTESETRFLKDVSERWRRKIVVVLNKIDLVDERSAGSVREFVRDGMKRVLGIEPPLFPLSTRSGAGVPPLVDFLRDELSASERIRLKIAGIANSLEVFRSDLLASISAEASGLRSKETAAERVLERVRNRVDESSAYFDVYRERVLRTFDELSSELSRHIDEEFGLWRVLKAKLGGNREQTKASVRDVIERMRFEEKLEEMVDDAAGKLLLYRTMIASEGQEYAGMVEAEPPSLGGKESKVVDAQVIARELKSALETGMNRFIALSSAAAASGISAKIATVAAVEMTSAAIMVAFAVFGLRALPAQREKLKVELSGNFRKMAEGFADSLKEGVSRHLASAAESITGKVTPELEAVRGQLASLSGLEQGLSELSARIESLRSRAENGR